MSQAKRAVKSIATSPEYKTLVKALKSADYEVALQSYLLVSELFEKTMAEMLEKIKALPRKNVSEDCRRFQGAYLSHAGTILPEWNWLDSLLEKEKLEEGQVMGFGSKGDPLVRTSAGKIVVLMRCDVAQGEQVRFKVLTPGKKVDFGQLIELTPDYFYSLVRRDLLAKTGVLLDSVNRCLTSVQTHSGEGPLAELSERLTDLEKVEEITLKLKTADKDNILGRAQIFRKRLLGELGAILAFQFLSGEEETEIRKCCQGDQQRVALALSAPGLLHYNKHVTLRDELFAGEELKKCFQIRQELRNKPDDLDIALKLAELKWQTEKVYLLAKEYMEKMDRFFISLRGMAGTVALATAGERACSIQDIQSAVEKTLSDRVISAELRRAFDSPDEFHSLRAGLAETRAILGEHEILDVELSLQDYLNRRMTLAFGEHKQVG